MVILFDPTIEDLVLCAERELRFRQMVYKRLVSQGKMKQEKADFELVCMQAIMELLRKKSKETC